MPNISHWLPVYGNTGASIYMTIFLPNRASISLTCGSVVPRDKTSWHSVTRRPLAGTAEGSALKPCQSTQLREPSPGIGTLS